MLRIGLLASLVACGPAGPTATPGVREAARVEKKPTWRADEPWTQLRAVAIDDRGRVGVIGHRLEGARAVGIVQVYASLGALAWEREIEAAWVEGVELAALPSGGFAALFHERTEAADQSVVYAFDGDGAQQWRRAIDLGKPERPHDLVVGPSGEIAIVGAVGSPAEHFFERRSVAIVLDADGNERRRHEVAEEAVAIGVDATGTLAVATDGPSTLRMFPPKDPPQDLRNPLAHTWDLAAMPGGWLVAGTPTEADSDPIVALGTESWKVGSTASRVNALAIDGERMYATTNDDKVLVTDVHGRVEPNAVFAVSLSDAETIVDLAVGGDGSVAFIGTREGPPWGRVDAWVVRLEHASAAWPMPSPPRSKRAAPVERWDARALANDRLVAAIVRWLDPHGTEWELTDPENAAIDRAVARALLRAGPLDCTPWLGDAGPDYRMYNAETPGVHSKFDDPCLRLSLVRAFMELLTADDLERLREPLRVLLEQYDDRVSDGGELGNEIVELAFARGRGPAWARAVLEVGHTDSKRHAIGRLRELGTPEARDVLREYVSAAKCDVAIDAVLALEKLGDPVDLDERPPRADAHTLVRRWCILRYHPDDDRAAKYWAKLVRRSYRYHDVCTGDWPRTEDESPMFGPCDDDTVITKDPPTEDLGNDVTCDETTCEIGSASYRENAAHGFDSELAFKRARNGELYVESVTVTRWLDEDR